MEEVPRSSVRSAWSLFGQIVLVAAAVLCLITAGRIEYWNWKAGGAIQKKLEQEPGSKWRIGSFTAALRAAKNEIRARDGIVDGAPLSEAQEKEAESAARAENRSARNRVGYLLREWGFWQLPLAMAVMISSLGLAAYAERGRTGFYLCTGAAGAAALFLALYRNYWGALGW